MDAVVRALQETLQSSLSLSGALQGDPTASIYPHLLTAAEDVTRMAGKALFMLNAANSAKTINQAGIEGCALVAVHLLRKPQAQRLLINQFI